MHAELKSLNLEPDPATLPAEPEAFVIHARLYIGPAGGSGEESFDLTVCSPEWLRARCLESIFYDARHHVVVEPEQFDRRALQTWLEKRVRGVSGETWYEIGDKLARLGYWEFEDVRA